MAKYCIDVESTFIVEAESTEEAFQIFMNEEEGTFERDHYHVCEPYREDGSCEPEPGDDDEQIRDRSIP